MLILVTGFEKGLTWYIYHGRHFWLLGRALLFFVDMGHE